MLVKMNCANAGGGQPKYSYSGMYRKNSASSGLEIDYVNQTYTVSAEAGTYCGGAISFGSSFTILKDGIYDILIYSNGALVHQGVREHVTANTVYNFTAGQTASTQLEFIFNVY